MTTKTKTSQPDRTISDAIAEALMGLVWLLLKATAVVLWWAVLFPMISLPLGLAVAAGVVLGWVFGVVVAVVSVAGIMFWRWKRPEMFERWVSRRARTRFLAWFRYRRHWSKVLTACGLSVTYDDGTLVPRLLAVDIGDTQDRVHVRMLAGQCPGDYENRTTRLAHAFGVEHCYASIVGPGTVGLVFRHEDLRTDVITLPHLDGGPRWGKDAA